MGLLTLDTPKGAALSPEGRYRYALWRIWLPAKTLLLFIGLNPSTANQVTDDPTVAQLCTRAYAEGFGGLLIGNLYAYVSSDPRVLLRQPETVGPQTDDYLREMIGLAGRVLCGWGGFKQAPARAAEVLKMVPEPYCLGTTASGQPRHPLRNPYSQKMVRLEVCWSACRSRTVISFSNGHYATFSR